MSGVHHLRHIDYYGYYSSKLEELDRFVKQNAKKGHGHRKLRIQSHRLYRNGVRPPRGMHDYQNLQWDPSIYRGRTFQDFREKNLSPNDTTVNFNKYCCFGCSKPKGLLAGRRTKTALELPRQKVGGVFRPTTDEIMFEESSGRKRHKQDESRKEMEPFIVEQLVPPVYVERGAQGDEIKERPKIKCTPVAVGRSVGTQADICIIGMGSPEDPLEPIFENMGSKILEQSLLETFEEYELHSIRIDIRGLMEKRRRRQAREALRVQHELFKAEKIEMERIRREKELKRELEADEMIAASLFAINLCNRVIAHTLDELRQGGFLAAETHDAEAFKPWLHHQMYRHLRVPRMIVDDIIQTAEAKRQAEFKLGNVVGDMEKILANVGDDKTGADEDEFSSFGAPPNTASSMPYTTTDDENESDREV